MQILFIAHWSGISACESVKITEQIWKRFLRLEYDNFDCNFHILLRKSKSNIMEIKRQRVLATDRFYTVFTQSIKLTQTVILNDT